MLYIKPTRQRDLPRADNTRAQTGLVEDHGQGKNFEEVTDNHNRLQTLSKRLDNFLHYRIGRDEILDVQKQYARVNDEKMKRGMDRIISRPIFQDFQVAESFEAQECFHGAWSIYHKANGDTEKAISHHEEQLRLWEINSKYLSKGPMFMSAYSPMLLGIIP